MIVLLFAYFVLDIRMQVAPVGVDDDVKEAANPVGDQNNPENKVSNSDLGLRRRIKIEKLNNFLQVEQAKDLDQSKEPENWIFSQDVERYTREQIDPEIEL